MKTKSLKLLGTIILILISISEGIAQCYDGNCFTQTLNLSTGFNGASNLLYNANDLDEYWISSSGADLMTTQVFNVLPNQPKPYTSWVNGSTTMISGSIN
jgi:hypothetical protein